MGRNTLRAVAVSGVLAAGVGLLGVSAASAAPTMPTKPTLVPSAYKMPTKPTLVPQQLDPGDGRVYVTPSRRWGESGTAEAHYKAATVDGLRVRSGPGTSHWAYGMIYKGQHVTVLATQRDAHGQRWDRVRLTGSSAGGLGRGFSGWVTEAYLY
ncbi:SH3 domain-containing protein [Streptomyces sp. AM 3-1-1]|uniref:SH3 domain-containing protein n=1 Tax=Streptomyces sp. AM 3-1-1 TaxID=3028711 RepID=UPI0023BA005C|nr:SH3 domain-containing protein [Streptomyces sp. AM 3-1-1]WEH29080.1 SH3 domain-containing protein [Streptomyces sp. AM 3-1-1]